jgi:hypothetical protein
MTLWRVSKKWGQFMNYPHWYRFTARTATIYTGGKNIIDLLGHPPTMVNHSKKLADLASF